MIIGVLRQFIFSLRSDFEVRYCFGFFAVQIVAVTQHVIFFTSLIVLIRKVEFQKLDGLFKLAQMKIRIAQNAR